ncbi:MAG: lytic transglycosylase domain-containing protein [Solirubrobacterales bacterium]|nr:lytic transglycosylase domain-containing protein [Solirubrobacterales bacterium]
MAAANTTTPRRRLGRLVWVAPTALLGLVVVLALGIGLALGGTDLGCITTGKPGAAAGPTPTRTAVREIPAGRLRLYQQAGRRYDIDWAFLAAVAAQECNHGPYTCPGDNGYGCAGPMQISMRRGSPCSPAPDLPTLWELYGVDGNRDGRVDVNDPADAIPAAARILREAKGAPPTGGSYADYRQASCNYYGACSVYADQVMARAVQYGFQGPGSPPPADPAGARPAPGHTQPGPGDAGGGGCAGDRPEQLGRGPIGPVKRLHSPRRFELLPDSIVAAGFGPIRCDARIVSNVVYLARRFRMLVTACAAIHSLNGEHPLGAAIDTVSATGDWPATVERAARALGWKPSCAASGVAPACARPPFRFIAYNGYPSHGDPAHCPPPACPAHLHLSWNTSASQGNPENQARTTLYSPSWIDVFTTDEGGGRG